MQPFGECYKKAHINCSLQAIFFPDVMKRSGEVPKVQDCSLRLFDMVAVTDCLLYSQDLIFTGENCSEAGLLRTKPVLGIR